MATGHAGGVIPRLLRRVGEHPLRERGVALLMSALHGQGAVMTPKRCTRVSSAVGLGREVRQTPYAIPNGTVAAPLPGLTRSQSPS
ncbi:BTAD domain-containing putative transcriptional regulator [Streptomyces canus]|uniref:BTAD domain-containing putative transcriptional regulator n=1 Tax=Streptomyces canus TaxID=58343 RepID=UPI0034044753